MVRRRLRGATIVGPGTTEAGESRIFPDLSSPNRRLGPVSELPGDDPSLVLFPPIWINSGRWRTRGWTDVNALLRTMTV